VNAINEHLKKYKTKMIPFVYPLVVYHGRPYQFTTNIHDLVDAPREVVERYFLKSFQLLDLNQVDDEVMKKNIWAGIMMFALKHIYARDMLPFLIDYIPVLSIIDHLNGGDLVGLMLQYTIQMGELSNEYEFFELINTYISQETGEKIMTLAEKLIIKGKLEGMLEEKIDMAKKNVIRRC